MPALTRTLITLTVLFTLLFTGNVQAQAEDLDALQREVQAIRAGQEQMQKDLDEIKRLLQQGARAAPGQQPFAPTDMLLGNVPFKGEVNAPVTLVEFSDYQCPFCKRHADTVLPALLESYVTTGKVRFVMREFPIENLHPRAEAASEAALCAADQGNYWGMHDALFNDQKANSDEDFQRFAEDLGLNAAKFSLCMLDDRRLEQIKADQLEGQKLGISGTPSFVLGLTDPDDSNTVHLTRFIRGAQPFPTFAGAIESLLESTTEE